MSEREIIAKYRANASLALPEATTSDLEQSLLTLDAQQDLKALGVVAEAGS